MLVEHHIARRGELLPPVDESLLQDYVLAANGIFTRGRRPGLEVCLPVADASVRGLRELEPYVQWGYPKVPVQLLTLVFTISQTIAKKERREALFYLRFESTDDGRPTTDREDQAAVVRRPSCRRMVGTWCFRSSTVRSVAWRR